MKRCVRPQDLTQTEVTTVLEKLFDALMKQQGRDKAEAEAEVARMEANEADELSQLAEDAEREFVKESKEFARDAANGEFDDNSDPQVAA